MIFFVIILIHFSSTILYYPPTVESLSPYYSSINYSSFSNIYYIDNSTSSGGAGTIQDPFNYYKLDVIVAGRLVDNTAVLFKRGQIHSFWLHETQPNNILFGAYGDIHDEKPIINTNRIEFKNEIRMVVVDIQVKGIRYSKTDSNPLRDVDVKLLILNCTIRSVVSLDFTSTTHPLGPAGIRGVKIIGCHFPYGWEDQIFLGNIAEIEIGYCLIEKANQKWHEFERILEEEDTSVYTNLIFQTNGIGEKCFYCPTVDECFDHCPDREANDCISGTNGYVPFSCGGDSIQMNAKDFHIHHNIIDRHDTGNKFVILLSGIPNWDTSCSGEETCIIEHNTIYGQLEGGSGGTLFAAYEPNGHTIIFRNNDIILQNRAGFLITDGHYIGNIEIYDNRFFGALDGIIVGNFSRTMNIYQNTFVGTSHNDIGYYSHGNSGCNGLNRRNTYISPPRDGAYIINQPIASFDKGDNVFAFSYTDRFKDVGYPPYTLDSSDIDLMPFVSEHLKYFNIHY